MMQTNKISYELTQPIVTAKGEITERNGYSIRIENEGKYGEGEIMPLPGWSTISVREAREELRNIEENSGTELSNEVRAGLGMAQWNLKETQTDMPLWALLGGDTSTLKVNSLIGGRNIEDFEKALELFQNKGSTVFKAKLGFSDDLERIRILANNVQPKGRVRLDPNGTWSLETAVESIKFAKDILGERLEYVEDPVESLEQLMRLRETVSVPIATDELTVLDESREFVLKEMLTDYIVIKPPLVGGIDATLEISELAKKSGVKIIISSTYDGPIGLRAWCHLAASISPEHAHGLGTADYIKDDRMTPLIPIDGSINLDSIP
ncbi:MAG: o-succinylbenzoate synthase [Actinomycetota bacterium]